MGGVARWTKNLRGSSDSSRDENARISIDVENEKCEMTCFTQVQ
jgi:hypothetical protein